MHIKLKNKRGQSTVEYVLLVTAVIAVIIAFFSTSKNGGFQTQMNATLNSAVQAINDETTAFGGSHSLAAAFNAQAPAPTVPWSVNVTQ